MEVKESNNYNLIHISNMKLISLKVLRPYISKQNSNNINLVFKVKKIPSRYNQWDSNNNISNTENINK